MWRNAVAVARRIPDGGVSDAERDGVFSQVCDAYEQYGVDPLYEQYGDYELTNQAEHAHAALATLCALVRCDQDDGGSQAGRTYPYDCASIAARAAARAVAYATARNSAHPSTTWEKIRQREATVQTALLRDIVGDPFHRVVVDPSSLSWNEGTVVKLAQGIYDDRAFDQLLLLADALEDLGCGNQHLLEHCRRSREHVRGCWALDLLLGKE
jgi:hypothetical protein